LAELQHLKTLDQNYPQVPEKGNRQRQKLRQCYTISSTEQRRMELQKNIPGTITLQQK